MVKLEYLREDSALPQLREAVDAEKLAEALQRHMGPAFASNGMQVQACTIDELRHHPGDDCRILFTAKLGKRHNHEVDEQLFFANLFRSQDAQAFFDSLDRRNLTPPQFGPAVFHIPEWKMIVWAYPNDPNLPGLPVMLNTEKILAMMQAAPERFGLRHPPVALSAKMTKYVPGMRCGFIYHATTTAASCAIYGKAYCKEEGEKAYAVLRQIWDSAACRRGELVIPEPYSYDAEMQILWQEALAGQPFAKIAETIPNLPEVAKEIGSRLAAFHGLHLDLPVEMTFDFQVEEVRQAVEAICQAFPDEAPYVTAVGQKLSTAAARLGPGPVTPVHASFKFSHIFATEKGIAFIDFDGANLGDPGYDLGRFLAHLYKMQANEKIAPPVVEQTAANFCASYNRAAASPVPQERIDWFTASHVIGSQVYKAVKRMNPRAMSQLLEIAERFCA